MSTNSLYNNVEIDFLNAPAVVKFKSCLINVREGDDLVLRASTNPHEEVIDRRKFQGGQSITDGRGTPRTRGRLPTHPSTLIGAESRCVSQGRELATPAAVRNPQVAGAPKSILQRDLELDQKRAYLTLQRLHDFGGGTRDSRNILPESA